MNELTKDKIFSVEDTEYDGEYPQFIDIVLEEDVILAVEETIKRIEDEIKFMDEDEPEGLAEACYDGAYIEGMKKALQIIKEQFPIVEKMEK